MKNYIYRSLILIVFLLPVKLSGQYDSIRYLSQKKRYWELAKQPQSLKRDTLIILVLDSMFTYNSQKSDANDADKFDYFKNFIETVDKTNWEKGKAMLLIYQAFSQGENRQYVKSIESYTKAENVFKKVKDLPRLAYTLIKMSVYIGRASGSKNALQHINNAISIAKLTGKVSLITMAYNHKGMILENDGKFKEALEVYLAYEKLNDPSFDNSLSNKINIGLMYLNLHQESAGLAYILPALKKLPFNSIHRRYVHLSVRESLVMHFISNKKFNQAQTYLSEIKNLNNNTELDRLALYDYQIQYGLGNYKAAIKYLETYRKYEESLKEGEKKNQVEAIKAQLSLKEQTEKLQKSENEKLRTENERQNQLRWFLIALSAVGLLSTVYVFRTNKKLKDNNTELLHKNAEISEALLKGQTIERQRVAMDLHDNLGSTLSALWLSLDTIDKSRMNEEEKEIHQNLRENLEKAYNDVRLLSHNLLPEEFEKQGLVPTLQGLVRKINKNSTITFDLTISEGFDRVANKVEFELYSICLELVNNILKHSKATEAKIELTQTEKQMKLIVSDNGLGTIETNGEGQGMKNIRARVDSLHGSWEIIPLENQGVKHEILVRL